MRFISSPLPAEVRASDLVCLAAHELWHNEQHRQNGWRWPKTASGKRKNMEPGARMAASSVIAAFHADEEVLLARWGFKRGELLPAESKRKQFPMPLSATDPELRAACEAIGEHVRTCSSCAESAGFKCNEIGALYEEHARAKKAALARREKALAGDGTYVYFGYHNWTTGEGGIATVRIADATLGKPTGTWPQTPMLSCCPVDLCFDGDQLWFSANDAPAVPIASSQVYCINFTDDTCLLQMLEASPTYQAVGHLAFDGLNVWVQAIRDMDGGGTSDLEMMYKISVMSASSLAAWTAPDAETRAGVAYLQSSGEINTVNMDHMGRTVFDGDGVVVVLNSHGLGDGMEGKFRTVPMAAKR